MKHLYFIFALCASVAAGAQNIYTVAGTTGGFSGNGGAATSAQIALPEDVKPDASGNFYISEFSNNCTRKVTGGIINLYQANGTVGFSGDGGPAVSAEMNVGYGCAFDGLGNVYGCDFYNQRIRKVNTSGTMLEYAGNGTAGWTGDGGQATAAELDGPASLCVDANNNLYIGDWYNNVVRKVNFSTGVITTVAGKHVAGFSGDGGPATAADLQDPEGIFVDAAGNLWIADTYNYRIRKVNTSGIISTVCGTGVSGSAGNGGQATACQLGFPRGVCVDNATGNYYIADQQSQEVRKVTISSGIISDYAGNGIAGLSGDGGPATAAELDDPDKCFLDPAGNLYISDLFNNRIRKIGNNPLPVTWLDFSATYNSTVGNVGLEWATASEENNKTFSVEHSTDGSTFTEIAEIRGAGNSNTNNYYSSTDEHPASGINYYRIKQIDYDGHYSYSTVKPVDVTSNTFTVFPNPASQKVNIAYASTQAEATGTVKMYNLTGALVAQWSVNMLAGTNTCQLDISGVNNGLYLVVFNSGTKQFTSRIVVNNNK